MSTFVEIVGNTGADVELQFTPNGTPVANFSVASNKVRPARQKTERKTDWFNVKAWGRDAETLAKYLHKGDGIIVRGELTMSPWLSREGEPRVNADVNMNAFTFLGSGSIRTSAGSAAEPVAELNTEQEIEPAADSSEGAIEDRLDGIKEFPVEAMDNAGGIDEEAEMLAALNEMNAADEVFAEQY